MKLVSAHLVSIWRNLQVRLDRVSHLDAFHLGLYLENADNEIESLSHIQTLLISSNQAIANQIHV